MTDSLPAVQKAQPIRTKLENYSDFLNEEQLSQLGCECSIQLYKTKEVEAERSGWEARENALKQKIKEQADKILKTRMAFVEEQMDGDCAMLLNADNDYSPTEEHLRQGCSECCFVKDLDTSFSKLLGLSK